MGKNILVVDDEADIAELVCVNLEKNGFKTRRCPDGEQAMQALEDRLPDLVVLDVMMPGIDGLEVCRRIRARERTAALPVLMLTARAEEMDKVLGLEMGADDYLAKPFSPREMVARVRALLRRSGPQSPATTAKKSGVLEIDRERFEVRVKGKKVELTALEFQLLDFLAARPERVATRDLMLEEVWGMDSEAQTRTVDVHVRRLRKKLGPAAKYIQTLRGLGYKFSTRP